MTISRHRLEDAISAGKLLEAGIISGLVFRLGGFQPGQEVVALNDATISMHALERGYPVLTRNIRDFRSHEPNRADWKDVLSGDLSRMDAATRVGVAAPVTAHLAW